MEALVLITRNGKTIFDEEYEFTAMDRETVRGELETLLRADVAEGYCVHDVGDIVTAWFHGKDAECYLLDSDSDNRLCLSDLV